MLFLCDYVAGQLVEEIQLHWRSYIEKQVQERFFLVGERDDGFTVFRPVQQLQNCNPSGCGWSGCALPAMWRSRHTVYGRVLNPPPPNHHPWPDFPRSVPTFSKELKTNGPSGKANCRLNIQRKTST